MDGKLLKDKRLQLGKTLEQLADEIGCSVRTLTNKGNQSRSNYGERRKKPLGNQSASK